MNPHFDLWVRLVSGIIGLSLVSLAMFITLGLWLESRRFYLALGAMAFLVLMMLSILRLVNIPDPPLLPERFVDAASLLVNAIWPLFGLAWLVGLLRDRLRISRLRRKHHLDEDDGR